jgi:hypothetical protein
MMSLYLNHQKDRRKDFTVQTLLSIPSRNHQGLIWVDQEGFPVLCEYLFIFLATYFKKFKNKLSID